MAQDRWQCIGWCPSKVGRPMAMSGYLLQLGWRSWELKLWTNGSLDSCCWPLQPWSSIRAEWERISCPRRLNIPPLSSFYSEAVLALCTITGLPGLWPHGAARGACDVHAHSIIWAVSVYIYVCMLFPVCPAGCHSHLSTHTPAGLWPDKTHVYLSAASVAGGHGLVVKRRLNKQANTCIQTCTFGGAVGWV